MADRDMFIVQIGTAPYLDFWLPKDGASEHITATQTRSWDAYRDLAGCNPDVPNVALVGKDGGVKRRWLSIPTQKDIFSLIDAMPMRMREMRER